MGHHLRSLITLRDRKYGKTLRLPFRGRRGEWIYLIPLQTRPAARRKAPRNPSCCHMKQKNHLVQLSLNSRLIKSWDTAKKLFKDTLLWVFLIQRLPPEPSACWSVRGSPRSGPSSRHPVTIYIRCGVSIFSHSIIISCVKISQNGFGSFCHLPSVIYI